MTSLLLDGAHLVDGRRVSIHVLEVAATLVAGEVAWTAEPDRWA